MKHMGTRIISSIIAVMLIVVLCGTEILAGESSIYRSSTVQNVSNESTEPDSQEVSGLASGTQNEITAEDAEEKGTEEGTSEQDTSEDDEESDEEAEDQSLADGYHIEYSTHVQKIGWQDSVMDGYMAGTTGKSYRLESIRIQVVNKTGDEIQEVEDAVSYRVHVQKTGWQDSVNDGEMAGTTGQSLRLEAIEITPGEAISADYDIYYRVHAQHFGWLGWAKNGETAGTSGLSYRLEAIEIKLVKKESLDAPTQDSISYCTSTCKGLVTYQTHVQTYGWQTSVADGEVAGTQGESKRVEAIQIWVNNPKDATGNTIEGSVSYQTHVQTYGWQDEVSEGELAGTTGESKRVEAIRINLTGDLAEQYDIYYRVHCQTFGTLDWAKNGETAGTVGYSKRIESIEIQMFLKDDESAPTQSGRCYLDKDLIGDISYQVYLQDGDWQDAVSSGKMAGTEGESQPLESLKLMVDTSGENDYTGSISYRVHVSTDGWLDTVTDGAEAGTPGSGKYIQAVEISLTDELEDYCDVYYSTQIQGYGWLGWAKNGQTAGSTGIGYRLEALKVVIVPKGTAAPGTNANYFKNRKKATKYVALTFDDGPSAYTSSILDQLEAYGAHATFFVVGSNVSKYSSTVSRMESLGCEIGNHTWNHPVLSNCSASVIKSEIQQTDNAISAVVGHTATVMRPPYGSTNSTVAANVGKPMILWSIDTLDWKTRNAQSTINSVMNSVSTGDIILMHDLYSESASAAIQLIPMLINAGYELVTISEMAEITGTTLQSGVKYGSMK